MTRWEPNARGRLEQAAMELYGERGFDKTTVEEIAARAGLTERTFFRHFTDKREVLFSGSRALTEFLIDLVSKTPDLSAPVDAVAATFEAVAEGFEERRPFARQRYALIMSHVELQEREAIKLASMATAIAGALRDRGVIEPAASLAAEAGVAIFKIAFEQWINDAKRKDLVHHVRAALAALKGVAAAKPPTVTTPTPRPSSKAPVAKRARR